LEIPDAGAERTDAGEDDRARAPEVVRVAGDPDLEVAPGTTGRALETLRRAPQVANPVVDDRDHSVPFVESTPVTRGSSEVAASSARANALKAASILWCGFRPRTQS